jgi:hypothetical protein
MDLRARRPLSGVYRRKASCYAYYTYILDNYGPSYSI